VHALLIVSKWQTAVWQEQTVHFILAERSHRRYLWCCSKRIANTLNTSEDIIYCNNLELTNFMGTHLLPRRAWSWMMVCSSCKLNLPLLMSGLRWWNSGLSTLTCLRRQWSPAPMPVLLNVGKQLLILLWRPWTFLQANLLTAWWSPH